MTPKSKPNRYWRIIGYRGLTEIFFDTRISVGLLSEGALADLLRCLTAKAGLNYEQIVGAYVRRGTKGANALLKITRNGRTPQFTCGKNPRFAAAMVDESSQRISPHNVPRRKTPPKRG
jgi:hypothetical protein